MGRVGTHGHGIEQDREKFGPRCGEIVDGNAVDRLGHEIANGFLGFGQQTFDELLLDGGLVVFRQERGFLRGAIRVGGAISGREDGAKI